MRKFKFSKGELWENHSTEFYMRVITGEARGKKLIALEGDEITRPTTDMVKESIFSIIQFDVPGANVLDMFAGSGQLGIEAISRGASHCVFVENNRDALAVVKENVLSCKFTDRARILNMDSIEYLKMAKKDIDIAFVDPPYRSGVIEKVMPHLERIMSDRGIVVCEHEKELELPEIYGRLMKKKTYKYGKIALTVYRVPEDEE